MRLFRNFSSLGLVILFFFCAIPFSLAQPADEFFAEEIVRTLVGSMTLVLAVPISTFLAAYAYANRKH